MVRSFRKTAGAPIDNAPNGRIIMAVDRPQPRLGDQGLETQMLSIREIAARHQPATDARAIGACEYGIRSWCARTGISYEAGQATVAEVYAAYQASPAPEARFAILHAARRARHAA